MEFLIMLILAVVVVVHLNSRKKEKEHFEKMKKIGDIGEKKVSDKLENIITKDKGRIFNNLMLQSKNFSTQIDHIVVGNNRTVVVIETKNYNGKIIGNTKDDEWIKYIGNKKYKFRNPMKQNNSHKEAIKKQFMWSNITDYRLINIVVFTNDNCDLQVRSKYVLKIDNLEDILKESIDVSENLSDDIYKLLEVKNKANEKGANEKHSAYVKKKSKKSR